MDAEDRFKWAIAGLSIREDDRVLEIGSGTGICLSLMAPLIKTGSITAVDRSPAMITKAKARLKAQGYVNKVTFIGADLFSAQFEGKIFTKVLAFNVNIFMQNGEPEMLKIRDHISPGGKIGLFFQLPPGSKKEKLNEGLLAVEKLLKKAGFQLLERAYMQRGNVTGGVLAQR